MFNAGSLCCFATDSFKSFEVKQMLLVVFSHVVLQTGGFYCRHQRFLVTQVQHFVFKEKRPARGEKQRYFSQFLRPVSHVIDFLEFTINKTHCWTRGEKLCLLWLFAALFSCVWLLEFLLTLSSLNPGSDASASAVCKLAFRTVPKSRLEDTFFISDGLLRNNKGNRISKQTQSMSNSWQANQYHVYIPRATTWVTTIVWGKVSQDDK